MTWSRNSPDGRFDRATSSVDPGVAERDESLRVGHLSLSGLRARLVRGISWNLIGTAFNQGSTFLVNIILANLWGLQTFGEYAIVQSTVAAVIYVSQLAAGYTATRYVAQFRVVNPERAGRLLGLCAVVSAIMSAAAGLMLLVAAPWLAQMAFGEPRLTAPLMVAALVVIPGVMNAFMMGALAGLEGYRALGRAGIVSGLVYVVACAVGAGIGGLNGAIGGVALSALLQWLILWRALTTEAARQQIGFRLRGVWRETDVLMKFAVPATLSGFVALPAIWLANAILVSQRSGYEQMALFTAANSFRIIALVVPNIVNNVGLSLLNNQQGAGDERRYRRLFWFNLGVTTLAVIVVAGVVAALGRWLLMVFGRDFDSGYLVLLVLMLAAVPETLAVSTIQPLQSQDRVWTVLGAVIVPCYSTLVVLAVVLTPEHGALGLAWAYVAGWGVAALASVALVSARGIWKGSAGPDWPSPLAP